MRDMEQTSLNFNPLPLSRDEGAVLSCLSEGREHALSSTEISRRTGLSERKIQAVIRSLRMAHGEPIGAAKVERLEKSAEEHPPHDDKCKCDFCYFARLLRQILTGEG